MDGEKSLEDRFWIAEIWENQWRPRGGVWSDSPPPDCSDAMLRPSWSTEDGSLALHPTAVWCPDGFEWDSRGWVLDLNPDAGLGAAQDAQGWSYAPSWRVLEGGGAAMNPRPTWPVAVRRRRYTRRARRWMRLPVGAPSAAGPQLPPAVEAGPESAPGRSRAGEGVTLPSGGLEAGDATVRSAVGPARSHRRAASEAMPTAAGRKGWWHSSKQRTTGPTAGVVSGPGADTGPEAEPRRAVASAAEAAAVRAKASAVGSGRDLGTCAQASAARILASRDSRVHGSLAGASAGADGLSSDTLQADAQGRSAQSLACEADTDMDTALALAELRDREIRKVAGDAVAIQSLMRQVAEAVSEQGEAVDRIDSHTRDAHGFASDGTAHLEHAHESADSCSAM